MENSKINTGQSSPPSGSVKIFALYHKALEVFCSDVVEPLQTGVAFAEELLPFHHDNEGPNISDKNKNYAELTGDYWVWKSYLPRHPEVKYVGMCHYRRFLDFQSAPKNHSSSFPTQLGFCAFGKTFKERYSLEALFPFVSQFDVVLDLRKSSPTFGRFDSFELSRENRKSVYIPRGCAHGFVVLSDYAISYYMVSSEYHPDHDKGILWNSFGFNWPVGEAIVSGRDLTFPKFEDFESPF